MPFRSVAAFSAPAGISPLRDIVGHFIKDPSHKVVRDLLQILSAISYKWRLLFGLCWLWRLDARAGRNQLFC